MSAAELGTSCVHLYPSMTCFCRYSMLHYLKTIIPQLGILEYSFIEFEVLYLVIICICVGLMYRSALRLI